MLSGSTDSAAVSSDGRQVVTGGLMAETMNAFSLDSLAPMWSHDAGRDIRAVAVGSAGVATMDTSGNGRLWSLDGRTLRGTFATGTSVSDSFAAFSPAGDRLAWLDKVSTDLTVWDVNRGARLALVKATHGGKTVTSMAFSPDGTKVVTCGADPAARVWRVTDGAKVADIALSYPNPRAVMAEDGSVVVADVVVKIFDGNTGARIKSLSLSGEARYVAASADGSLLAVVTSDGWLNIMRPQDWSLPLAAHGMQTFYAPVLLTADGARVVSDVPADSVLRIWRTSDMQATAALAAPVDLGYGLIGTTRTPAGADLVFLRTDFDVVDIWCL
jgi:WD40 repeat protein